MSDNNTSAPAPSAAPQSTPSPAQTNTAPVETSTEEGDASETPLAPAAEAQIAKKIKQLKLKIDGKEVIEDLPFEIDDSPEIVEYLQKQLQLSKVSQKRMSESSEYKKQLDKVGDYLNDIKGNPGKIRELMKDLGLDEKEIASMIVEEEIANSKKSPEQVAKEALEQELKKLKDERETEKKEAEAHRFQQLQEKAFVEYNTQIEKVFTTLNIPSSPYAMRKMADYLSVALENKVDLTPEDVGPLVKQEIEDEIRAMFKASPDDAIEHLLGQDNVKRLRKSNLKKGKPAPAVPVKVQDVAGKPVEKKDVKKMTYKDFFKMQ